MDFKNLLKHMRGGSATSLGHRYEIGLDGIVHDVLPEHAERMLICWKEWEPIGALPPTSVEESELEIDDESEPKTDDEAEHKGLDEAMEMPELKAMADELSVSYGPNIGKALLLERIKEALDKE